MNKAGNGWDKSKSQFPSGYVKWSEPTTTTGTYGGSATVSFPPTNRNLDAIFNDMFFLGFHDQLARWQNYAFVGKQLGNFPPYNIIKIDDDNYEVELAVAGYSKSDIEVLVERDQLLVSSKEAIEEEDDEIVIYQGIAKRKWSQKFFLGEFMEVTGATMKDGLLIITVKQIGRAHV